MTYKLKLNQVREVLGMEVKLEAVKLIDGVTTVEYERLEPGFPLFVIAEDGTTKTPAPAGEHTLEDGTTIEVDNAGMIMEVSGKEEEIAEEAPVADATVVEVSGEEMPMEDPKVSVAMEDTIVERVTEKVAETMKAIFEAVEEVAKEVAMIKEEMGSMKTKMEKFSKAPAATSIPKIVDAAKTFDSFDAKVEAIKSAMKK
jgi:hypothetical protein